MSDFITSSANNTQTPMEGVISDPSVESQDSTRLTANSTQDLTNKRKQDSFTSSSSPKSPNHKIQKSSSLPHEEQNVVRNLSENFNTTFSQNTLYQSQVLNENNRGTNNNNNNQREAREESREQRELREEEEAYTVTDDLDFDVISRAIESACPIQEEKGKKHIWIRQMVLSDISISIVDLINDMKFPEKFEYNSDLSGEEILYANNIGHKQILAMFPFAKKVVRIAFTSATAARKAKEYCGKGVYPGSNTLYQAFYLRAAVRMPEEWIPPTDPNTKEQIDLRPDIAKFLNCPEHLILKVNITKTPSIVMIYFHPSNEGMTAFIHLHSDRACKGNIWGASFHTISWMAMSNLPSLTKVILMRPPSHVHAEIRSRVETSLNKVNDNQFRRENTRKILQIKAAVIGKRTSGRQPDFAVLLYAKGDVGPRIKAVMDDGGIQWNTSQVKILLEKDYEKMRMERKANNPFANSNDDPIN